MLTRLGLPVPVPEPPVLALERASDRLAVVVRLTLNLVLLAYGLATPDLSAWFWAALAAGTAWSAAGVVAHEQPWWRERVGPVCGYADAALLTLAVLTTGGADAPVRQVVLILPVVSGVIRRPGRTLRTGVLTLGILLAAAVPDVVRGHEVGEALAGSIVSTAFATLVGLAFASGLTALAERAAAVDQARRRLLSASLDAEDGERRRVSKELGGETLQLLLAGRQDLGEATSTADRELLQRAREQLRSAVAVLRETVRDLHPTSLRHAGLGPALLAAMEHRITGEVRAAVAPDAIGVRETMLLGLVRELGDALREADRDDDVQIQVFRDDAAVVLEVRARHAPEAVGRDGFEQRLARVHERVEADGGSLHVVSAAAATQTAFSVRLPVDGRAVPRGRLRPDEAPEVAALSARMLAGLRLAGVVVSVVLVLLDGWPSADVVVVATVTIAWQVVGAVALTRSGEGLARNPWLSTVDLALMGALVHVTGGATSPLLAVVLVVPFLLIFRVTPATAVRLSVVLGVSVIVGSLEPVLRGEPGALRDFAPAVVAMLWSLGVALSLGVSRERLRRRVAGLEQARRRVLHDSLDVADHERRRLSEFLHDHALQVLMIAGQDLDEALEGDAAALELARDELEDGIRLVRLTMAELHPPALEHGGLRPAVVALLEAARVRGGFDPVVSVSPDAAGLRDELVLSLIRELVTNAAKHAQAAEVRVRVARHRDELILEVADDGVGMAANRAQAAIGEGHIGLIAARERVDADGGRFELDSTPGAGTRIRIRLAATATAVLV